MEYVEYGKTGLRVSRFGLGCMRFPENRSEAVHMVHYAIDNDVNYVDTAYMYPDSEEIVGEALQHGYRERTYLVTKSPIWLVNRHEDFEKYLDEELKRLKTDHIDIYLMHNLYPGNWDKVQKYDGLTFLDNMIKKGKILHKGFSIHDSTAAFRHIADSFDWEMAQIQLNILDAHQQVGVEGLEYGAQKGMAMVIMEPLRGGSLVNSIPQEAKDLIAAYPDQRSIAEWCFRWLYDKPEISVILSGTSTLDQLKDNLRIFEYARSGVMTGEDQELISRIRQAFENQKSIGCTGCRYCMPCPKGVGIPDIFRLYNSHQLTKPNPIDKQIYQFTNTDAKADKCVECGICMKHCPQGLEIPELLKMAHTELSSGWK